MALGAVDVAKEKGLIGSLVIFGNDGEVAVLESIEAASSREPSTRTAASRFSRIAAAKPAGPAPTMTTSYSIASASMVSSERIRRPVDASRYLRLGRLKLIGELGHQLEQVAD
jgi:hypothetical protein